MATIVRFPFMEILNMRSSRVLVLTVLLGGLLAMPTLADAQGRSRGRAVPRGSVRAGRPPAVVIAPRVRPYSRPFTYRSYRPGVSLGFYSGYPGAFGPFARGYGFPYGYGLGYGLGYGAGYGLGYGSVYGPYRSYGGRYYGGYTGYGARGNGGVRIDLPQRDAEVYVDGYYAGIVDDFDGSMQKLDLEPGPHTIRVQLDGFETVSFDVNVEPFRTIRYRSALREALP